MTKNLLMTVTLALATWVASFAQGVTTASISGEVTDKNGEPLPGANVIAIHVPSGTKYGATTRTDGRYDLPAVRIGGPYSITVSFVGYEDQKSQIDYLSLDQNFTSNFRLGEIALQLSEVQVTAQKDPVLNSERTGAATSERRELFERLPTITRSFQDMIALDPRSNGASSGFGFGGRSNLYNNFTIDGATSNNVFGLNALPGGQANAQPISVDAIQAAQINFAPYDVRQGSFTGAGVNVVTRSGTNEFSGSVYDFFKNQSMVGTKLLGVTQSNATFSYQNIGFRLGGPIIKNKLFFFVNYENEKSISPAVTYPVNTPGNQQIAVNSSDPNYGSENNLQRIVDFFKNNAGVMNNFNPGSYNNFNVPTQSQKYLARFDYNISDKHKLTVRYNQLNALRDVPPSNSGGIGSAPAGGRQNSNNALPFSNSFYRQLNNLYNIVAELNSTFSNKYSNTLTLGYSAFRDPRQQGGGGTPANFPTVDILGTNGSNLTTFGPDPFTPNNKLYQDIIQVNDNFNIYKPNHVISVGTANEFFKFNNTFTQQINGVYQFSSISNFINNALTPATTNAPSQYLLQYSAVPGTPAPGAIWKAQQLGFYVQDQYTGIKNVKLTYGMRIDLPTYPTNLPQNPVSDALTFANGEKVQVGKLPTLNPLYSPRIGFNWDMKGDKTLQLRGGSGVFTGRVPFVWLSNQVTNNGLLFGSIIATGAAAQSYNFSPTPLTSNGGPSPQFAINATVRNFKFPQVWRTNLAIDKSLPWGLIGTLEAIYTKNLNAIYYRDANFNSAIRNVDGDGRPQFAATIAPNPNAATDANGTPLIGRRINQNITQAVILDNTSKGYQYMVTGQLQKTFERGFYASAAYTYTDSRDVNSETGSTASTNLTSYAQVSGYNTPVLSYSSNLATHHVVASASYRKEYLKFCATTISGIYQGSSGNRFSYTYSGDVNSDGNTSNDLIYIPKNQNEILLTTSSATDTRTVNQIWQQLDNYINQDKYLSKHRGEYAARNGATMPWFNYVNLRLLQDFYIEMKNGKRNTLQFSFEAINFMNLLNSNWGVVRQAARSSLLTFVGYENPAVTTANTQTNPLLPSNSYTTTAASGRPIFRFDPTSNGSALTSSWTPVTTTSSRYQLQLGVRYIFN
jgi:hypothetical protein